MKKTLMYAKLVRNGKLICSEHIGIAMLDEDRVSARKYNELKLAAFNAFPNLKKGEYISIETADGLKTAFGGYPAQSYVKFELA